MTPGSSLRGTLQGSAATREGEHNREEGGCLEEDAPLKGHAVVPELDAMAPRGHGDREIAGVGDEDGDLPAVQPGLPRRKICPAENDVPGSGSFDGGRRAVRSRSRRGETARRRRSGRAAVFGSGQDDVASRPELFRPDEI